MTWRKHATLFTRAHSTTSWTNPAVESLFTGTTRASCNRVPRNSFLPNARTLAAGVPRGRLPDRAIIANPVLPSEIGLAQGSTRTCLSGWVHGLGRRPKEAAELVNDAAGALVAGRAVASTTVVPLPALP